MLILALSFPTLAQTSNAGVIVKRAWSRASIGTSRPGAAYMEIQNTGSNPITLTGIYTDLATVSEIHLSSTNDDGVSSMALAGEIEIAPGRSIALEPGGLHAMLMLLQRPMSKGDTYLLILVFSDGSKIPVTVPILGVAARGPEG